MCDIQKKIFGPNDVFDIVGIEFIIMFDRFRVLEEKITEG